ncbi:MAG TPA: AmmeMemoRadiSam system protein B [Methanobacteriaceae archaeon]|nr:AmmeMemoRadiSam system protein B [Methanobacteriaceae archaeon]
MSQIRKAAVAGLFYEANPRDLKRRIRWCYQHQLGPGTLPETLGAKRTIKGLIVPHAGYMYSGPVAAHSYLELARDGLPETFIILCPNHTGRGSLISTMTTGEWETPLGRVQIDTQLAQEMLKLSSIIDDEPLAHQREHSVEAQLPFIQYLAESFNKKFKIVPIAMMMQDLETATEVGKAIYEASKTLNRDVVVVASTDLTHYKSQEVASQEDKAVLDALKKMDQKVVLEVVEEYNVNMCGYGPLAATMTATKLMGASEARVLKYATSGETSGNYQEVVGYAAGVIR